MSHAFDRHAFDVNAFDVDPVVQTQARQPSGTRRHVRPIVYLDSRPISHPSVAASALPQGVSMHLSLGAVSASGTAVAKPYGQEITLRSNNPLAIGIVDISDEDLIFLISAA